MTYQKGTPVEEGCIIIQSCDKYQHIWPGLFWSLGKYWDFQIPWKIYFCNEEKKIHFPNKRYQQILTGRMGHSEMMAKIISSLSEYKYIFYMLDDFWPTDRMTKEMFMGLFNIFKNNQWESLKITAYQPSHYKLENTNFEFNRKKILKYAKNSRWKFSQQASFWKREVFESIITDPMVKDKNLSTSLPTEIAMDEKFCNLYPEANVYLYNYIWYPVSGVMWRGVLTQIGEQIEFERKVEETIKIKFN
jgi:hypothetical protein